MSCFSTTIGERSAPSGDLSLPAPCLPPPPGPEPHRRVLGDLLPPRPREPALSSPVLAPGQSGLGKSTLINTLFKSKISRKSVQPPSEERIPKTIEIKSITHGERAPARAGGRAAESGTPGPRD